MFRLDGVSRPIPVVAPRRNLPWEEKRTNPPGELRLAIWVVSGSNNRCCCEHDLRDVRLVLNLVDRYLLCPFLQIDVEPLLIQHDIFFQTFEPSAPKLPIRVTNETPTLPSLPCRCL